MEKSYAQKLLKSIDKYIESFENKKFLEKNENRNLGIIYTPHQVVEYIISNIFRIYFEKFINSQKSFQIDNKLEETLPLLLKNQEIKEKLINIIKSIKILDPSCGSGRFLILIAEKLYQFHRILDPELKEFEIKKSIIQNNLYGIEIETSAYIISKLRLIKWFISTNINSIKFLNINLKNIKFQDWEYFIKQLGMKFNIFNLDFLLEFSSDKFDIIIGNPPYVENKKIKDIEFKKKLKKRFKSAYRLFDLSVVFIERSFELLKPNSGCLCMITTNKFLSADYGIRIRRLLLNNTELKEIINISSIPIFNKTSTYPIIISFKKKQPKENHTIKIKLYYNLNDFLENLNIKSKSIPQNIIKKIPSLVFPIFGNTNIINYFYTNFKTFSQTFTDLKIYYRPFGFINWAIHLNKLKYIKTSEKDLLLIGTGNVGKYHIKFDKPIKISGKNLRVSYFQYNEEFRKIWNALKSEKLIFREMAKHLTWIYDPGLFANVTGLYFAQITSINSDTLFCILAIMNSKLMDLLFKSLFGTLHMSGGYLRFNGSFIKRLPMPRKFPEFISKLGKILQLLSQLKYDLDSYRPQIMNNFKLGDFKNKYFNDINTYLYFFNKLNNALVNLLYLDEFYLKANSDYDCLRKILNSKIEFEKLQFKFLIYRFEIQNYSVYQLKELESILTQLNKLYNKLHNNTILINQIEEITRNDLS